MNMLENVAPAAPVTACQGADDAELLASLRQGRAGAYERLMRRYNRLLFRTARGIVPDDAEAQDAVQEAYLRALTALDTDTFRGQSTLATWLVRIVINQALQQQRRRGRLVQWDAHLPMEDSDMPATPADMPDAAGPESPEHAAARQQLRRQLEAAIDVLPPIYRCVFLLRAVQELSVEETADALRVSGDVVKTRYLRAREMLRSTLAAQPAAALAGVHDFRGQRCDDIVRHVLAALRAAGVVRDQ
jgi:RNA polymerase sigma-70 factor (ECF subfamily)